MGLRRREDKQKPKDPRFAPQPGQSLKKLVVLLNEIYPTDIATMVNFKNLQNLTYVVSQLPNKGAPPPWTPAPAGEANKYYQK